MSAPMAAPSAAALARVRELLRRRRPALVAIDGPSGAGKTTLAEAVAAEWRRAPVLIQLDTVYRGWEGLDEGAAELRRHLVPATRDGRIGRVREWDWARSRVDGVRTVRPGRPLVIEGCGAFAAVAEQPDAVRILVEAALGDRRGRALRRDAGAFDPYWELWETQWRRHRARERGGASPDLVIRA
ncbi:zeta toxin family protein [Agromyces sp. NPDC060279]|uniref:zeta toxin family protein n=1 Tax=Agromyces sp. NPDC060279 TaxID=3347092 RepID=UPI00364CB6E9